MGTEKFGPTPQHQTPNDVQRITGVSEDDVGSKLPMPSDENDFEKQQQMATKANELDEMWAKYDNVLQKNERTQLELLTKTTSKLRDTVKSLQAMLVTVFPADQANKRNQLTILHCASHVKQ